MAFPTLPEITFLFVFSIFWFPIVYLLSRVLKIRAEPIPITNPKREAIFAIIVGAALAIWVFAWWTLSGMFHLDPPQYTMNLTFVAWTAFLYVVCSLPVIAFMRSTRQTLGTLGIEKKDMGKMVAFGLILGAMNFVFWSLFAPYLGWGFTGFSPSLTRALIFAVIVGSSEEILFRGYIQTRLVAFGGRLNGLVFAAFFFAFWHFGLDYYHAAVGNVLATLVWTLVRIPFSLLFGYLMLKTQNIIPPALFHLLYDWGIYVWAPS